MPWDLHSVLLVSRAWCECSVELLWHKPHLSKLPSFFKMISVICCKDLTFTYPQFMHRLNFLMLGLDLSSQSFTHLTLCCQLEQLMLVNCNSISDGALSAMLLCCQNLVMLDLTNIAEMTDHAMCTLANTALRLQGLNLGGCKLVTHEGVTAITWNCPQLHCIKLSGLKLLNESSLIMPCPCSPHPVPLFLRLTSTIVSMSWMPLSETCGHTPSICMNSGSPIVQISARPAVQRHQGKCRHWAQIHFQTVLFYPCPTICHSSSHGHSNISVCLTWLHALSPQIVISHASGPASMLTRSSQTSSHPSQAPNPHSPWPPWCMDKRLPCCMGKRPPQVPGVWLFLVATPSSTQKNG